LEILYLVFVIMTLSIHVTYEMFRHFVTFTGAFVETRSHESWM